MGAKEIEFKLLQDYLDAALAAEAPEELAQRIAVYEKQILVCKSHGVDFNESWCESMVFYLQASLKLKQEGFFEKTLRGTAQQASDFGTTLYAGMLAKEREESRIREAISLLSQALQICYDSDYLFLRAILYQALKDKQSALKDVEQLLKNHSDDQEIYLSARKLKDEIEVSQDKECFIATAVYAPTEIEKVDVLRTYRDKVLLHSAVGKAFVSFYYAVSPGIARIIAKSQILKSTIRVLLEPIVKAAASFTQQQKEHNNG